MSRYIDDIVLGLSLVMLVIIAFRLRKHFLSTFRDRLFKIRHDFLIYTNQSTYYDFDSELYKIMEGFINTNLQFAHNISFFGSLVFMLDLKLRQSKIKIVSVFEQGLAKELKKEQYNDIKEEIVSFKARVDKAIAYHLFKTSPLFTICIFVVVLNLLIRAWVKERSLIIDKNIYRETVRPLELQAENYCFA